MLPKEAIAKAFEDTAASLKGNTVDCRFSGSTAILCVLFHTPQGRRLTTGWVGDSRAMIGRSVPLDEKILASSHLAAVPLTRDHKPTLPSERCAIWVRECMDTVCV